MLVTPLQLANGYATLANGGNRYVPQLVQNILESRAGLPEGQTGALVRTDEPTLAANTMLDNTMATHVRPVTSASRVTANPVNNTSSTIPAVSTAKTRSQSGSARTVAIPSA